MKKGAKTHIPVRLPGKNFYLYMVPLTDMLLRRR